ncbi:glucan endo-1,3-alpha-glucosidase agn1 [Cryptomeria japonica]|uniref:glucan endo-1,3-alpha-glucosidase agn1 n=1 Tax=Cryptomeria japonica TaxID=3369 RepID=UPI0025ACC620|nr:glucan endo-1,3-alpha-glucosidase agn1 [Cryptomeria japonica]
MKYRGKPLFTSWLGSDDSWWKDYNYSSALTGWNAVFQKAGGRNKFFYVPFFPTDGSLGGVQATLDKFKDIIDGLFAWDTSAWPYFSPDFQNPSVSKDQNYLNACKAAGKVYMASPSSWFFKNIAGSCCSDACKAKDLSNCNCQVKGNYQGPGLWIKKWEQLIQLSPPLLEIVTWNDWVETSYVAPPLSTAAADVSGYTHRAFLELGQYYFNWYKSGSQPAITQDSIYLFYYTQSKNINVPADGCKVVYSDQLSDKVYVTAKLTGPATVELRSGSATHTFSAPKGISTWSMDFQAGQQLATLKRGGKVLSTLTGSKLISNSNATHYNFNVYSTCTTC